MNNKHELKQNIEYQAQKKNVVNKLQKSIKEEKFYILTVKPDHNQPNKVYPNFATAKLSYIKNNKMYTELITSKREHNKQGHCEAQIFEVTENKINQDLTKYKEADYVILDLHTALSMCTIGNSSCYQKANQLINSVEKLIGDNKIAIRVGYNFPYSFSEVVQQGDGEKLFQYQIELTDRPCIFSPDNIIISSWLLLVAGIHPLQSTKNQ